MGLARPLIAPAAKALATEGLTFGAEKTLKIFGKGICLQEIQLQNLVQQMTLDQRKAVTDCLDKKRTGACQHCPD